jgi:putative ABC transport system substrate-binding protein
VAVEYRSANEQLQSAARRGADLVRRQVFVIAVLGSTPGALAAKAATTMIPIVFGISGDPVASGLVTSLNRPGGNAVPSHAKFRN